MLSPQQIQEARQKIGSINTSKAPTSSSSWDTIKFPGQTTSSAPAPAASPSFMDSVGSIMDKGAQKLGAIADKYGSGKQGLASSALQTAGQAAGALTDIGMEGLKRVTPEVIKAPIKQAIQTVSQTKPAQTAMSAYEKWSQQHPEAAANLEATVNLASVLPGVKLGQAGAKATSMVAKTVGKDLVESGANKLAKQTSEHALNLVKPIETKATKLADVSRTTETGKGIFKKSIIAPTKKETLMAKEIEKVPGIHPGKTFQQNYNVISEHSKKLADDLKKEVSSHKVVIPRQEMFSKLKDVSASLSKSPLIVGDAEKMANKLLEGAKSFITKNSGTAEGLFQARKDFDSWVKSQKPTIFDAKTEGALTIANREIRQGFNDLLDTKIPGVKLKDKLYQQHHLLDAVENIAPKAAEEAKTAIKRSFQRIGEVLGTKNKAVQATAAALGIGGLGAAATFAPAVAGAGIPAFMIYKGGKAVLKPEVRSSLGKLLGEVSSKLKTATDPIEIKSLNSANETLKKYLKDVQPGLSIKNVAGLGAVEDRIQMIEKQIKQAGENKQVINRLNKDYMRMTQIRQSILNRK